MNAFFGDRGEDQYIKRICKPPLYEGFKYWLLNVVEQVSSSRNLLWKKTSTVLC